MLTEYLIMHDMHATVDLSNSQCILFRQQFPANIHVYYKNTPLTTKNKDVYNTQY